MIWYMESIIIRKALIIQGFSFLLMVYFYLVNGTFTLTVSQPKNILIPLSLSSKAIENASNDLSPFSTVALILATSFALL